MAGRRIPYRLRPFVLVAVLAACSPQPDTTTIPAPDTATAAPKTDPVAQARQHLDAGRFGATIEACQAGLAQDSTQIELYNMLATAYAAEGRYALAIEALDRAVGLDPGFGLAYLNLGGIYTKLGQYDKAEENLKRALPLLPAHPSIHRRLAELYLGTQRYTEAAEQLRQALALLPDDPSLLFFLGQALEGAQQPVDALAAFQKAATRDLGFTDAHYRTAGLARRLGHKDLARDALKRYQRLQAIGGDPNVPKQLRRLRAAILNAPEDAGHHYRLGLFFLEYGYVEEAVNKFDHSLALKPPDPQALNRIGGLLLKAEHRAEALTYYQRAATLDPSYLPAQVNAGSILSLLGRHDEALQVFERALQTADDDPAAYYFYALAAQKADRPDLARHTLSAGLELPDLPPSMRSRMEVLQTSLTPRP